LLLPAPVPLSFDAPLLDVRASSLDSGAAVKPSESLDAPEELDAGTGSEPNRIERREIGGCRRCCGSRGCGGSLPSRGRPSSLASSSSSNGSAVVSPDASIAGSISVSAIWMVRWIGGSIDRSTRTLVERLALLQSMRESIVRWHCHLASQLLRSIRSTLIEDPGGRTTTKCEMWTSERVLVGGSRVLASLTHTTTRPRTSGHSRWITVSLRLAVSFRRRREETTRLPPTNNTTTKDQ